LISAPRSHEEALLKWASFVATLACSQNFATQIGVSAVTTAAPTCSLGQLLGRAAKRPAERTEAHAALPDSRPQIIEIVDDNVGRLSDSRHRLRLK
jgi:hypothetical protein